MANEWLKAYSKHSVDKEELTWGEVQSLINHFTDCVERLQVDLDKEREKRVTISAAHGCKGKCIALLK